MLSKTESKNKAHKMVSDQNEKDDADVTLELP